jgi:hypothetical protein
MNGGNGPLIVYLARSSAPLSSTATLKPGQDGYEVTGPATPVAQLHRAGHAQASEQMPRRW